jgi:hypothetical protein
VVIDLTILGGEIWLCPKSESLPSYIKKDIIGSLFALMIYNNANQSGFSGGRVMEERVFLDPTWVESCRPVLLEDYFLRKDQPGVRFAALVKAPHLDVTAILVNSDEVLAACSCAVWARSQFCYSMQLYELKEEDMAPIVRTVNQIIASEIEEVNDPVEAELKGANVALVRYGAAQRGYAVILSSEAVKQAVVNTCRQLSYVTLRLCRISPEDLQQLLTDDCPPAKISDGPVARHLIQGLEGITF